MLKPSKHLKKLFGKYLLERCSPGEVREFVACFSVENEHVLRALITATLEDVEAEDEVEQRQWTYTMHRIMTNIQQLK